MFRAIWNFILRIEHSVESITADLTNTVKRLEQHAAAKFAEVTHHTDVAEQAARRADAAAAEAVKAEAVSAKIGALLNG